MRVRLLAGAAAFLSKLPPESKKALRRALQDAARGKGNIKALEKPLSGWCRVASGRYRAIYRHEDGGVLSVVFIESRSVVYEMFEARLASGELS